MHHRMQALQQQLGSQPQTGIVLAKPSDITYFTGFEFLTPLDQERDAYLVVTTQTAHLIHASFSPVKAQPWLMMTGGSSPEKLRDVIAKTSRDEAIKTWWVDTANIFVTEYQALQAVPDITLSAFDRQHIWQLRMHKDEHEIAALKKACEISRAALMATLDQLREGMSERDVARFLEDELRSRGSGPLAFPTIVCFGKHAALPHHQPTDVQLTKNTPVLIDMGGSVDGYRADMTRTVWFGDEPSAQFGKIEQLVQAAYQAALSLVKSHRHTTPTITAKAVDAAARAVIDKGGYGNNFIHTTGHGVGLEIHEPPSLSWRNDQPIEPGMTITIEPGIYLSGELGYRYENTVVVTDDDCIELTI